MGFPLLNLSSNLIGSSHQTENASSLKPQMFVDQNTGWTKYQIIQIT